MRRVLLAGSLAALLLGLPAAARARPWHGLTPGISTKSDVLKKFGSPTRELPMTARYSGGLVYQAKEAQEYGADEAQFFFDEKGKLLDVFVFPNVALKRDDVIKAYGTAFEERRTDDFRLYFQYKADGFVVFFDKDNESVYQLQFTVGTAPATPPAAVSVPSSNGGAPQPTPLKQASGGGQTPK
jgi:hypothetical protein